MSYHRTLSRAELEAFDATPNGNGSEKRFRCPFCQNRERAFHVNFETGAFNCKRASCNARGQLRFWQHKQTEAPIAQRQRARTALARAFSADLRAPSTLEAPTAAPESQKNPRDGNWRDLWEGASLIQEEQAAQGARYLYGRGITVDVARVAGVRFCQNWALSSEGRIYRAGAAVLYP